MQIGVLSNVPGAFDGLSTNKYLTEELGIKFIKYEKDSEELLNYEIIIADAHILSVPFWENIYNHLLNNKQFKLKWIMNTFAGVNLLFDTIKKFDKHEHLLELLQQHNIILTKIGIFGPDMLEYILQHILNDLRNNELARQHQSEKQWDGRKSFTYKTLNELTIGILGYGNIGKFVCEKLKFLSPKIKINVFKNEKMENLPEYIDACYSFEENNLNEFLSSGLDYLINILPSTHLTRYLLNGNILQSLKEGLVNNNGCCFINCGRGDIISEDDIINALDNQWIRKVVSDVFVVEPLPKESKLWERKDVIITPHVAALTSANIIIETLKLNYKKYLNNEMLDFQSNWKMGTSSGFGREFVHTILERGDKVIATARDLSKIQDLVKAGAHALKLDVTSGLPTISNVIEEAIKVYGQIDVLINNAAVVTKGTIEDVTPEETFKQFDTNIFGLLNTTRAILPHMRERKEGTIVNIGSIGGFGGAPTIGLYCATKFALEGISESLQSEVAHLGIKVLLVEPGYFRTSLLGPQNMISTSNTTISDYDQIYKGLDFNSIHNTQRGDPKKLANIIVDVITGTGVAKGREMPFRLPLGADAYPYILNKLNKVKEEMEPWKEIITSTDLDEFKEK
ncbi:hypothetical protein ABK040_003425 [Willaertia magna]